MGGKAKRFLGILSNAGIGFEHICLPSPFSVKRWHVTVLIDFLCGIEDLPEHEIVFFLNERIKISELPQKRCAVVTAELPYLENGGGAEALRPYEEHMREEKFVGVLESRLKAIRLFWEGNVRLGAYYTYDARDCEFLSSMTHSDVKRLDFRIPVHSAQKLNQQVSRFAFPVELSYLSLAYEYYERSYHGQDLAHSYLLLMIAAEILFNAGHGEISYKICRGVAVLLAESNQDGLDMFNKMKKLYGKRSKLVHEGKEDGICHDDVRMLRMCLRHCILKLCALRFSKKQLEDSLKSGGMGDFSAVSKWGER